MIVGYGTAKIGENLDAIGRVILAFRFIRSNAEFTDGLEF